MKIIDNKKDYYDYLSGIYGEDTKIAYDRRGSIMIDPQRYMADSLECLFANKYFCDKPRTSKYTFSLPKWHQPNEKRSMQKILVGEYYYFLLETGYRHYLFEVERYLDEEKNNVMVPLLINLSSLRDVPITDTRLDVQKMESAGFDRIVSFRNVK